MKKLISILVSAMLLSFLTVSAFAAEFAPNLTVERADGVIVVTVANDDETNAVLAEKKPTLTIDCSWESAKLLAGGKDTALTVKDKKVSFTVTHGGIYLLTNRDYSVTVTPPGCTENGKYVYTIGSNSYEEAIPAIGHDFKGNAKYCRNGCGTENPDYIAPIKPSHKPVTSAPNEAEQRENPFTDISENDYFYDCVLWAVESGITAGMTSTTFAPDGVCTRAEMVTFLWRAAGTPEPSRIDPPFADVTENDYFRKAVLWAVENGITNGTGTTAFSPNETCTRAQAVTFLYRYAAVTGMDAVTLRELVSGYADAANVPPYALPAFNWALGSGVVVGYDGMLMPKETCKRVQVVTMLYRLLGE